MKAKIIKLKDGATMLYKKETRNKAVFTGLYYNVGAANTEFLPGMLHLGEHLRAKRTASMTIEQCNDYAFQNSLFTNAHTSNSRLGFICESSKKRFVNGVKLITDKMLYRPLSEDLYNKEVKVVLNETQRALDSSSQMSSTLSILAATDTPFYKCGHPIGLNNEILNYTQQQVQDHISKVINTHNLVATVVGNISKRKAKATINKLVVQRVDSSTPKISALDEKIQYFKNSNIAVDNKDLSANIVSLIFPIKDVGFDLEKTIVTGNYISRLLNSMSGILLKALRVENSLVYGASASMIMSKDKQYLQILYKINKDDINQSLKVLSQALKTFTLSQERFLQVKERIQLTNDMQDVSNLKNVSLYLYYLYTNFNKILSDRKYRKLEKKVTMQEVVTMYNSIFKDNKVYVHIYGDAQLKDLYTAKDIHKMFFKK